MLFNRSNPVINIEAELPLLEAILEPWKSQIGVDYVGYKNHCYRVLNFCLFLHEVSDADKQKFVISAGFHDLGLWTEKTINYLPQ
jgi:hypothetical protein